MVVEKAVVRQVLKAARMVVTDGLGDGRRARGFSIVVGNAHEILAYERGDPGHRHLNLCKYGSFRTDLDPRSHDLRIGDCLGEGKGQFLSLFHEAGAIVVDEITGKVCCGGFSVHDSSTGIGSRGARTKSASTMATQAGGCYVVVASEAICGSAETPVPPDAAFTVFERTWEPRNVPIHVSDTVREQSFEQWIRPLIDADLRRENEDFVEGTRQWILDDLEQWRRNLEGSRCRVLLAGPGFGKTSIVARLHKKMTRVLAIHLCRHSDGLKRDTRCVITSVAHQVAEKLPQFEDAVRKVYEAEGGSTDAYSARPTARELADCLLFNPLTAMEPPQDGDKNGRHVIIIDALDEAERDTKNDLLDLVAFDFCKLPRWVALLVTARPEVDIRTKLAPLRPTVLDAEVFKNCCAFDVGVYLRSILKPRFEDEGSLNKAIDTIAIKSEGLFLYLHHIREIVKSGDSIDALPIGLAGVYQRELERVLGPAGLGDENSKTRWVVEAIIAAQVPVHVKDELPSLSGVPSDVVMERVRGLSRLLTIREDGRVCIFHKSFVEWLTRDKRPYDHSGFIVDCSVAHRRLASACGVPLLRLIKEEADRFDSDKHAADTLKQLVEAGGCGVVDVSSQAFEEYALRWSVAHLVAAGKLQDVGLALLCSLRFLLKRAPQIDTLITDAAMLLPTTEFLHRALLLAQNHVRLLGAQLLAEELWQRLLSPAETREIIDLQRLVRDARTKARADLMFSARRAYFTPADSKLHCVLEGHLREVKGVTTFMGAPGHTWVASCSDDNTVRIWDPIKGGEAVHVLEGHSSYVRGVKAFKDATGHTWVASFSDDKTVRIWDPIKGGETVQVLNGHSDCVNGVATFKDTKGDTWVASCSNDETVRIWDAIKGGKAVRVLRGHSSYVLGVTALVDASRDTWLVASCSFDWTVRIWDAIKGEAVHVLQGHSRAVTGVAAFVDAKGVTRVASCSKDKTVCIWDPINGGQAVQVLTGHSRAVTGVIAFKDAEEYVWLASCSRDQTVRIWEPITRCEAVSVLEGHSDDVIGVSAFVDTKGKTWVVSCSDDKTVRIWDPINGGEAVHVLKGHSNDVKGVTAFVDTEGNTWVTSCSSDKAVHIWDPMKGGKSVRMIEGHSLKVVGVTAFVDAEDRAWVASCSDDATIRIWDPNKDGKAVYVLNGHSSSCSGVTAFADAKGHKWVASWSHDATVRIWNPAKSAEAAHVLEGHSGCVSGVIAFVDAKGYTWVASCSHDATVHIWDPIIGGEAEHVLKGHFSEVNGLTAFVGPNGHTWVASCSDDQTVRIWDPINGDEAVHVHEGHSSKVNDVTTVLDAQRRTWVASCSDDKTVRIWDPINGGEAVHVLKGHSGDVCGVAAFAGAEGPLVASCSKDRTVRIWDPIKGGTAVHVLKGHSGDVSGVTAFAGADGHPLVVSCSTDKTVRIWDLIRATERAKGDGASFVIPLESRALAISTLSAGSSRGAARVCLVIGHEDGRLSYWDHSLQCGDENLNSYQHIGPPEQKRVRLSC